MQSDNGREFVNHIIKEMMSKWPACKIINGRPRHPQSQGSVERSNQDVENMLRAWLSDNNTQNWSLGCYFVQWHKNSSFHRIIGRSPYKALFGVDFQVGLYSSSLPHETIKSISTEEDLEDMIKENSVNSLEESDIIVNNIPNETEPDSEIFNIDDIPVVLQDIVVREGGNSNGHQSIFEEVVMDQDNVKENDNSMDGNIISQTTHEINQVEEFPCFLDNGSTSGSTIIKCITDNVFNKENGAKRKLCLSCDESEGICNLCEKEELIKTQRTQCTIGQKRAADQMVQITKKNSRICKWGSIYLWKFQNLIGVPLTQKGY